MDKKNRPIELRIAVNRRPMTSDPVALTRFHCLTIDIPNMEAKTPMASSINGNIIPFWPYVAKKRTPISIPVIMSSLNVWNKKKWEFAVRRLSVLLSGTHFFVFLLDIHSVCGIVLTVVE